MPTRPQIVTNLITKFLDEGNDEDDNDGSWWIYTGVDALTGTLDELITLE